MLGDAGDSKTSVWICYGFIHFAYFLFLATPLFVRKNKNSHTYDKPLYTITASYFIAELITGVTLILVAPETVKVAIIIQVILAAIFIAWLLIYLIANEHTAASVEQREKELQFVKESSSRLQSILSQITDKSTTKRVERLYDLLRSSPVHSNFAVFSLEQQITSEIEQLADILSENNEERIAVTADKIYRLVEERNRQLKISNR
jgi:mannitol-specific phosphotransferase system IIBC component